MKTEIFISDSINIFNNDKFHNFFNLSSSVYNLVIDVISCNIETLQSNKPIYTNFEKNNKAYNFNIFNANRETAYKFGVVFRISPIGVPEIKQIISFYLQSNESKHNINMEDIKEILNFNYFIKSEDIESEMTDFLSLNICEKI